MDWIIGIQRAIDHIEENLTREIDYERIAAEGFSSNYHFQRVFHIFFSEFTFFVENSLSVMKIYYHNI